MRYARLSLTSLALIGAAVASGTAVAAVSTAGCAASTFCTMTELLAGGSLTAGGVTFSGFDDSLSVDFPDTDLVTIEGIDDGDVNGPGISFGASPEFAVGASSDFFYRFDFDVSVSGAAAIDGFSMELTSFSGDDGVDDIIFIAGLIPSTSPLPAELLATDTSLTDSFALATAVSMIEVEHRVTVDSFFGDGVTLEDYEFRVSVVPVPPAIGLFLSALFLTGAFRASGR